MEEEQWQDFGQRLDLTARLREILVNYPEGTSICKELIQNADDAGASVIKFCFDRRQHPQDGLVFDKLAEFQGASLLVYNDSIFNEADFESISRVGDSMKTKQAGKIGKFGVGFNSCYHLTDVPSFVSGCHLVLFDPHCEHLPNISVNNPGKKLDFVKYGVQEQLFVPYCAFGCQPKKYFKGTLFRFPLRTKQMAAKSRISKQVYDDNKITELLEALQSEATLDLLFLKHIYKLEVYEWKQNEKAPQIKFSSHISNATPEILKQRSTFLRLAQEIPLPQNFQSVQPTIVQISFENSYYSSQKAQNKQYLVVQGSGDEQAWTDAYKLGQHFGVRLVPWGGVAIQLDGSEQQTSESGRCFCFLPLPTKTGLPIQVNGFFELSSNRRDIWWGSDMSGVGEMRARWNQTLVQSVIPKLYLTLIQQLHAQFSSTDEFYRMWPTLGSGDPWKALQSSFYDQITGQSSKMCISRKGVWGSVKDVWFPDGKEEMVEVLSELGMPMSGMPKTVNECCITALGKKAKVLSPSSVRDFLLKVDVSIMQKYVYAVPIILDYCVSQFDDFNQLVNLPLLLTMDGSVAPIPKCYNSPPQQTPPTPGSFKLLPSLEEYPLIVHSGSWCVDIEKITDSTLDILKRGNKKKIIDIRDVGEFETAKVVIPSIIPDIWKNLSSISKCDRSKHPRDPSNETIQLLWQKLLQFSSLEEFQEYPIVPLKCGGLARLVPQEASSVVYPWDSVDEQAVEVLDQLGCKFIDSKFGGSHPQMKEFVKSPQVISVLQVLSQNMKNFEDFQKFGIVQNIDGMVIRNLVLDQRHFQKVGSLSAGIKQVLRSLPIFLSPNGETVVLCDQKRVIAQVSVPRKIIDRNESSFVVPWSDWETNLLVQVLDVLQLNVQQVYRKFVYQQLQSMEWNEASELMLQLLRLLPQISASDKSIISELAQVKFIRPKQSSCQNQIQSLKSPLELFDPRVEELVSLLDDSCFPGEPFNCDSILVVLQQLGIKTQVDHSALIRAAESTQEFQNQGDETRAQKLGFQLFSYLERNVEKIFPKSSLGQKIWKGVNKSLGNNNEEGVLQENFWSKMCMTEWCPVLKVPPEAGMPWMQSQNVVAMPASIRSIEDAWKVSHSMHILDGGCRSRQLSRVLGWNKEIKGNVLALQLMELGRMHTNMQDEVLRQTLASIVPQLYAALTRLSHDEIQKAQAFLLTQQAACIWVGDGFAPAHKVALKGPLNLSPWLYVTPGELAPFSTLFLELGVLQEFRAEQFINMLRDIEEHYKETALNGPTLLKALAAAQSLSYLTFSTENLPIPDQNNKLVQVSDLLFNDAPWIGDSSTLYRFVHPRLSNEVAEKLGVSSLRRTMLATGSNSVDLGVSAEAFGQSESLTGRLRHILELYADGPGVLLELIQNADDAGATKFALTLDCTSYPSDSVLGPQMSSWQGPALLCYNDAMFTQRDMQNICKIGQDSKLREVSKTGRFGLGFNAVYHFTDVPSFVSGEHLVLFDPHATNLPGVVPASPGLKISFKSADLATQFPDTVKPYFKHYRCDLKSTYHGTLFRFPLRTQQAAEKSEIKPSAYPIESVMELLQNFANDANKALLFLKNVKNIELNLLTEEDVSPKQLFSVQSQVERRVTQFQNSSTIENNNMQNATNLLQGGTQLEVTQFLNSAGKDNLVQKLQIAEEGLPIGFSILKITKQLDSDCETEKWLVGNMLAGGEARQLCISKQKEMPGAIPWVGVAGQIHPVIQESCVNNISGQAFCFLPLPVKTQLPVHVNGWFQLSSNRRDIWHGSDMTGEGALKSQWNLTLIKDGIAPLYAKWLAIVAKETQNHYCFFPTEQDAQNAWKDLVPSLYENLKSQPVLHIAGSRALVSPSKALVPDQFCMEHPQLSKILTEDGIPLTAAQAPELNQILIKYYWQIKPEIVCKHYISKAAEIQWVSAKLFQRELLVKAGLILEYCLLNLDPKQVENINMLDGLPLIPRMDCSFTTLQLYKAPPEANSQRTNHNQSNIQIVFIAREREASLLQSVSDRILHLGLNHRVTNILEQIGRTKKFNVRILTPKILSTKLLPQILPIEWMDKSIVDWSQNSQNPMSPSVQWMQQMWDMLVRCQDVSEFARWPLVPVQNSKLASFRLDCQILVEGAWSEEVSSVLQKLGCVFLDSAVLEMSINQFERYVYQANAMGVLSALTDDSSQSQQQIQNRQQRSQNQEQQQISENSSSINEVDKTFQILNDTDVVTDKERDALREFLLQPRWFMGGELTVDLQKELMNLPIYKSGEQGVYTQIVEGMLMPPEDVDARSGEWWGERTLVVPGSVGERNVMRSQLGIDSLDLDQWYGQVVAPNLETVEMTLEQKLMFSGELLDKVVKIERDFPQFIQQLRYLKVIVNEQGDFMSPACLYDPRNSTLRELFSPDGFPHSQLLLSDERILSLTMLGMQTSTKPPILLKAAERIQTKQDAQSRRNGKTLIRLLDSLTNDQHVKSSFWDILGKMKWVPVVENAIEGGMPWKASEEGETGFGKPTEIKHHTFAWHCSGLRYIVDDDVYLQKVGKKFAWDQDVPVEIMLKQLELLGNIHKPGVRVGDTNLRVKLQGVAQQTYMHMQDAENGQILGMASVHAPVVWAHNCFVPPIWCVQEWDEISEDIDPAPYLVILSEDFHDYTQEFMTEYLHINVTPNFQQLQKALISIYEFNKHRSVLPVTELSLAIKFANGLSKFGEELEQVSDLIHLPNVHGEMKPANELFFQDEDWLNSDSFPLVHRQIKNSVAEKLGVRSLRYHAQLDSELTRNLVCPSFKSFENLLQKGEDDSQVMDFSCLFSDILEIAETCKCRKVSFILDECSYGTQSVFLPALVPYQGPSILIVLHGARIAPEELATLHEVPRKEFPYHFRGRLHGFGRGLLCAYSFTDILTAKVADSLVMFDPKGEILQKLDLEDDEQTGIGKVYTDPDGSLANRFKDQFHVWKNIPTNDRSTTSLRIPLHKFFVHSNAEQDENENAENGDLNFIQSKLQQIKNAIMKFKVQASRCLLFFEIIEQIQIERIDSETKQLQLLYQAQLNSSRVVLETKDWQKKNQFTGLFRQQSAKKRSSVLLRTKSFDHEKSIYIEQLEEWLVSVVASPGRAREIAQLKSNQSLGFVPVSGIAYLLQVSQYYYDEQNKQQMRQPQQQQPEQISKEQQVCCVPYALPINQSSGLDKCPFTVYGGFQMEIGTRKMAQSEGTIKGDFNMDLLRCIVKAFTKTFDALRGEYTSDLMYALIPKMSQMLEEEDILGRKLCKQIYEQISGKSVWLLTSGKWVPLSEGCFPDPNVPNLGPLAKEYVEQTIPLFNAPGYLATEFEKAGIDNLKQITPKLVRQLVKSTCQKLQDGRFDITTQMASELFVFCVADILPKQGGLDGEQLESDQAVVQQADVDGGGGNSVQRFFQSLLDNSQAGGGSKEHECLGIPVPTGTGKVIPLGCRALYIWPFAEFQRSDVSLLDVVSPTQYPLLLHPNILQATNLENCSQQFLEKLHLVPITYGNIRPLIQNSIPISEDALYCSTQKIDLQWFQKLWKIILGLSSSPDYLQQDRQGSMDIARLDDLFLIPTADKKLARVACREAVYFTANMNEKYLQSWVENLNDNESAEVVEPAIVVEVEAAEQGVDGGVVEEEQVQEEVCSLAQLYMDLECPVLHPDFYNLVPICGGTMLHQDTPSTHLLRKLQNFTQQYPLGIKQNCGLEKQMCEAICDALKSGQFDLRNNEGLKRLISNFAIYPSLANQFTSIGSYYTSPDFDMLVNQQRTLPDIILRQLLQQTDYTLDIYEAIALPKINQAKYFQLLFDYWEQLDSEAFKSNLLRILVKEWRNLNGNEELVGIMKRTKFVKAKNGTYVCPSELMDPSQILFTIVYDEDDSKFPASDYSTSQWLVVLRDVGLITSLDNDKFVNSAVHVSEKGVNWDGPLTSTSPPVRASRALTAYLQNMLEDNIDPSFLCLIKDIQFVTAIDGVPGSSEFTFQAFSECALLKDWPLIWSVMPVLEKQSTPPPWMTRWLEIKTPPPISKVVSHCQEMQKYWSQVILRWPTSIVGSVSVVTDALISYLNGQGTDEMQRKQLYVAKFLTIANHSRLISPNRLFMRIHENWSPLVYELPEALVKHMDFLRSLGIREQPSAEDVLQIVSEHLNKIGIGEVISVNELQAAKKMLEYLVNSNSFVQNSQLQFIPDVNSKLIYVKNAYYIKSRVGVINSIDAKNLALVHPSFNENICRYLGIQSLEERVVWQLNFSNEDVIDQIDKFKLEGVKNKLRKRDLQLAVWSVVQHFQAFGLQGLEKTSVDDVIFKLDQISNNLKFVSNLNIQGFVLDGFRKIPIGKKQDAFFHTESENQTILISQPPQQINFQSILSAAVSEYLGSPAALPLDNLLDAQTSNSFGQFSQFNTQINQDINKSLDLATGAGTPGSQVTPSDLQLIELNPQRWYEKGEVVAIQQNVDSDNYIYGRIAETSSPSENQALYYINVEIGPNQVQYISSHQIYSFASSKETNNLKSHNLTSLSGFDSESNNDFEWVNSPQGENASNSGSANLNSNPAQNQAPALSAKHVVSVVRDMLKKVNVPVSLEQEELLQHSLELKESLKESNKIADDLQDSLQATRSELEENRNRWQCKVCWTNDVNVAFANCGHMICSDCAPQCQLCPICRKASKQIKLFK